MRHSFEPGRGFSVGIEEELMIVDAEGLALASGIQALLRDDDTADVKSELHECVLEIATQPAATVPDAGEQLRRLRDLVRDRGAEAGLAVAGAGTHPFSRWDEQRISPEDRYRALVDQLGFVARQEVIFGQHVHVAVDDPETAVKVANGLRLHVPLLMALGANSPFWMGQDTGLASARMPVFRQFPRVGLQPHYAGWEDWERRIEFMVRAGMVEDHTWFWWDVRLSPGFGTVEVRAMDAQTRVQDTLALTALVQALVRDLAEAEPPTSLRSEAVVPDELLAENRWQAGKHGPSGELVDLPSPDRVPVAELARRLVERLRDHARDLGSEDELDGVLELVAQGGGAARQRRVHAANGDLAEVVRDLVEAT